MTQAQRDLSAYLLRNLRRQGNYAVHPVNPMAHFCNAVNKRRKFGTKPVSDAHMYVYAVCYDQCVKAGLV